MTKPFPADPVVHVGVDIAGGPVSHLDPDDVTDARGIGCLDCGTEPDDLCFCASPRTKATFADYLANDPRWAALIESRAPAHRASARRLNWRSAILFDPLQIVATLAPRGDVLTPATGAALGVLAEQIGRAA